MAFDIVYIQAVHQRTDSLFRVLVQNLCQVPKETGLSVACLFVADQPTTEVAGIITNPEWGIRAVNLGIIAPRLPIRSPLIDYEFPDQGCVWARDQALHHLDQLGIETKWAVFYDDDWIYDHRWPQTLRQCLEDPQIQSWRAASLFIWDENSNVNLRQHHCPTHFFRWRRGDRMRQNMCLHAPARVADLIEQNPKQDRTLPWYILDIGTTTPQARRALFRGLAAAGKVDPYTHKFIESPVLRPLDHVLQDWPSPQDFVVWQHSR